VIVFDASALVEVLLSTGAGRQGLQILEREDVVAPELLDVEVLAALTNYEKRGELDGSRVDDALADLLEAPVERLPHRPLLTAARRHTANLSAYDALYVALASALGCGLVTADGRLSRAPGLHVAVTLLQDDRP
jgi:predicted nucleic acid-binding protein